MIGDGGGSDGGEEVYSGKADSVLVSLSDLYSEDKEISVCDSRPSSSSAYTITDYLFTGYCPKKKLYDVDLRRSFYSKQGLKDSCCSPV